jgi:hypothetical protein
MFGCKVMPPVFVQFAAGKYLLLGPPASREWRAIGLAV